MGQKVDYQITWSYIYFSLITIYIFPPIYCFWIRLNLYNIGGNFPLSFKASIKLMVDVTIKDLLESRNS